jgi:DNA repair exonuclease SbcCD ATPase subunit
LNLRSQALRETKELKWLIDTYDDDQKEDTNKKKTIRNKDVVCPFCKKKGHKTRIAKACQKHHEWLDINNSSTKAALGSANKDISSSKNKSSKIIAVS